MNHSLPLYIAIPTILIMAIFTVLSIYMYFRVRASKKRVILQNEKTPNDKQVKISLYKNWGGIMWFLLGTTSTLSCLAIFGLALA